MTSVKVAAGAGLMRSSSGTNSTVTQRPPGLSAACAFLKIVSQVGGSK
jgi:hypothetical protein